MLAAPAVIYPTPSINPSMGIWSLRYTLSFLWFAVKGMNVLVDSQLRQVERMEKELKNKYIDYLMKSFRSYLNI